MKGVFFMSKTKKDNVFDAFHHDLKDATGNTQERKTVDHQSNNQGSKVEVVLPNESNAPQNNQAAADRYIDNNQVISPAAEHFIQNGLGESNVLLDYLNFQEVKSGDPAPVMLDNAFFTMIKEMSIADDGSITINFFNGNKFIAVPQNWLTNSITVEKLMEVGVQYSYVPNEDMLDRLTNVLVHNGGNQSQYGKNRYFWIPSK